MDFIPTTCNDLKYPSLLLKSEVIKLRLTHRGRLRAITCVIQQVQYPQNVAKRFMLQYFMSMALTTWLRFHQALYLNKQTINSRFPGSAEMMKVLPDVYRPDGKTTWHTRTLGLEVMLRVLFERESRFHLALESHEGKIVPFSSRSCPDRRARLECNVLAICRRMFIAALRRPNTRLRKATSERWMVAAAQFRRFLARRKFYCGEVALLELRGLY